VSRTLHGEPPFAWVAERDLPEVAAPDPISARTSSDAPEATDSADEWLEQRPRWPEMGGGDEAADPLSAFASETDLPQPQPEVESPPAIVAPVGVSRSSSIRLTWAHGALLLLGVMALAQAVVIAVWVLDTRVAPGTTSAQPAAAPGQSAALAASSGQKPALPAGWLTVSSPVPARIWEDGTLLGTTEAPRLMLTAGTHHLEFDNPDLGFHHNRTVTIDEGGTTTIGLGAVMGTLSLDSRPGTEVWVDGQLVGTAPIERLSLPIGRRELRLRHPDHGERHHVVLVPVTPPLSLTIDLRP
jgi:hypothetical protein